MLHNKIDNFVGFCIPVFEKKNTTALDVCKQKWDTKSNKIIIFIYEKFILHNFFSSKLIFIVSSFK